MDFTPRFDRFIDRVDEFERFSPFETVNESVLAVFNAVDDAFKVADVPKSVDIRRVFAVFFQDLLSFVRSFAEA